MAASPGVSDGEQVERARSYHRPLYLTAVEGIVLDLALLAVLSFTVVGDDLYALTDGSPWWARGLAFSVLVVALIAAVDFRSASGPATCTSTRWHWDRTMSTSDL